MALPSFDPRPYLADLSPAVQIALLAAATVACAAAFGLAACARRLRRCREALHAAEKRAFEAGRRCRESERLVEELRARETRSADALRASDEGCRAAEQAMFAAQQGLREARAELEERVEKRTSDLEAANEALQAEVIDRTRAERRLAAQQAVSRALVAAESLEAVAPVLLRALGENLGWSVVSLWVVEGNTLRRAAYWQAADVEAEALQAVNARLRPAPGEGLPGNVWQRSEPVWVDDAAEGAGERAPELAAAALRATCGFPLRDAGSVCGVIELYSRYVRRRDEALLPVLASIGEQIGQTMRRQRAESELRATAAELTRSNRELEQFAYVASHDLQEPLRKILTISDRLKERSPSLEGPDRDYFGRLQSAGFRMKRLIEDLLDFSRVSVPQPAARVELDRELDGVLSDLSARLRESGATVERPAPLPAVQGNATQMRQLLQNLVSNAIKFSKPGAPPRVRVAGRLSADGKVELEVSDDGIGFDERYLDRIFKPFQRLHGQGVYDGTGIGLAICQKIVQRHGGSLTARSAPGRGATFVAVLPAAGD